MVLPLWILGGLAAVAGLGMIAWGGLNNPNDLGNTFIIAGTTALVGGLILIALGEAVRQLRRIAEGLMTAPVGQSPRDLSQAEPAAQAAMAAGPRIPFPPKVEPRKRAPVPAAEPRLDIAPSIDAGADHFERPAPRFERPAPEPRFERSTRAPEPRVIPEHEELPLSPAEPRLSAAREEKDELSEGLLATAFSRLDVSMRPTAPDAEQPSPKEMFEAAWPAPRRDTAPEPMQEDLPVVEAMESEPPSNEQPAEQEAPYAVSILKSGVVDGMAYTLYSDGSIEAEMPQGTMRFASITELRGYLEKSSS